MNRTKGILVLLSSVIFQSGICGQQTKGPARSSVRRSPPWSRESP